MDRLADIGKALFVLGALMVAIGLIMPLYYLSNVAESHGTTPDLGGYPFSAYSASKDCDPSANSSNSIVLEFCSAITMLSMVSLLGLLLCAAGPALYAYSKLAGLEGHSYSIRGKGR